MTYRLLAFDLDGTAAEDGRLPTQRVIDALAAARANGLRAVLATGRSYAAAQKYALALGLVDPLIVSQGALVRELAPPRATLLQETLPIEPLVEFLALAQAWDLDVSVYGEDEYFVTAMRRSHAFHDRWFGLPMHEVASFDDALRMLAAKGDAPVKALITAEPAEADQLVPSLVERFAGRLTVVRSHAMFIELVPPRASKGNALAFLAHRYGIPRSETVAVGDSGNDVSMIRWAGLGVAMGNATPDVLAVADRIAPSVQEDGLAAVIEGLLSGNGRN